MSGYWIDSPDNPFNRMKWTRGGGGYDNEQTRESNDRRASAMEGAGASALPHFATVGVARALSPTGMSVVGDNVIAFQRQAPATSGAGSSGARTAAPGQAGSGPGVANASTDGRAGRGGAGSGSQLRISTGVIDWRNPFAWDVAPEPDGIANKPLERIGIGGAQEAPGAISDIGWIKTTKGWVVTYSSDAKERTEDDVLAQAQWHWRNTIGPSVGIVPQPVPEFLDLERNQFDFWSGEWRPGHGAGRAGKDGYQFFTGGGF